jgi:hypothetical protein
VFGVGSVAKGLVSDLCAANAASGFRAVLAVALFRKRQMDVILSLLGRMSCGRRRMRASSMQPAVEGPQTCKARSARGMGRRPWQLIMT